MATDDSLAIDPAELDTVREFVLANRREGVTCPGCGQHAKMYRRKITAAAVRTLAKMYATHGQEFLHLPSLRGVAENGEAKLRYWGLVEDMNAVRDDGGHAGYWRVTDQGVRFLRGEITVPKYALVYNGELVELDATDGHVTAQQCLGHKFNLAELMAGI
jgi:hypothetical protein